MLLPSSIHRAEDFVGMAIPMVALSCASAPPTDAAAARPASASASNVVFGLIISLHSLRDRISSLLQSIDPRCERLLCACEFDVRFGAAARSRLQQKGAAMLGVG